MDLYFIFLKMSNFLQIKVHANNGRGEWFSLGLGEEMLISKHAINGHENNKLKEL